VHALGGGELATVREGALALQTEEGRHGMVSAMTERPDGTNKRNHRKQLLPDRGNSYRYLRVTTHGRSLRGK
jgi:hypothetical protein